MTSWDIYWIMQADMIRMGVGLAFVPVAAVLIFSIICAIACAIDAEDSHSSSQECAVKARNKHLRNSIFSCLLMFIPIIVLTFMPTTRSMAAIYIVPAIANNEDITRDVSEVYTLGIDKLKSVLKETDTQD